MKDISKENSNWVSISETDNRTLISDSPTINLVLQDGDDLIREIKEAQRLSAELQKSLERIKKYNPRFRYSK
ncbi:hypothetical protein [Latilactobacillus sakei]|uniref:hypothetical protein n=1 Tax=Latilactobacillus sakei TaxID=1599 RepID=UPI000DC64755|nr:hypothetical protein [Latilactobacillus sakei]SPS04293.1 hypothetical protein LAS9624_01133 [Latilactobacillus sakei]